MKSICKVLALCLCFGLVISMCACKGGGGGSSSSSSSSSKVYTTGKLVGKNFVGNVASHQICFFDDGAVVMFDTVQNNEWPIKEGKWTVDNANKSAITSNTGTFNFTLGGATVTLTNNEIKMKCGGTSSYCNSGNEITFKQP